MIHDIKIWPQYFERVKDGSKTFEVRENTRGYQPGDGVILREWDPKIEDKPNTGHGQLPDERGPVGYSGRYLEFRIGYLLPLTDGKVVFSLLPKQFSNGENHKGE